ncbi:MAG: CBS domain-containing protein [Chitinophagales bacterium]
MIAPHLISDALPILHTDDSGEHALIQMHEFNVNQLPVIENGKYIGLVTMEEVISMKHLSKPLNELVKTFRQPFVLNNAHIFDVMKAALEFNVRLIPVVNEHHQYLGTISAESCLRAFAVLNSVNQSGAIIELEIAQHDYSLAELAGIVEEAHATVLCLYSHINTESGNMEVTLKVNITDITQMVQSFERFNYEVKAVYNDVEYSEDMKDRYDALMRYLNV